jgi:hypothetical protein
VPYVFIAVVFFCAIVFRVCLSSVLVETALGFVDFEVPDEEKDEPEFLREPIDEDVGAVAFFVVPELLLNVEPLFDLDGLELELLKLEPDDLELLLLLDELVDPRAIISETPMSTDKQSTK